MADQQEVVLYDLSSDAIFNNLWMTPNPDVKGTPLLDVQYLRNGVRQRHSYNGILTGTYTRPIHRCNFK